VHTDKNSGKLDDSSPAEVSEEASAGNLNWLLDMDMSEPEERLFTVDQAGQVDTELTDYELEVARRPMTRGAIGADDLETYIDEEIVISSETQGGDIYESAPAFSSAGNKSKEESVAEPMAIDYSRQAGQQSAGTGEVVSEGADILGLAEEDDIGEKYFVIKRVKPPQQSVEVEPQAPVCETTEAVDKSCDTTAQDELIQAEGVEPQVPVIEMTEQETPASPVVLSDAPVLRLVNPGSPLDVANDEADSDNGAAGLAASAEDAGVAASLSADSQDVLGYIASVAPPSDDQAFDNYLLNGKQLDDVEADINELTLEPIDGEAGYDADPVEAIDYHEDFHRLSAMSDQNAASLAQLIPQLMEELSGVLEARLAELGLPAGSVQPELVLGGDVGAAERLGSEGYEPAIAICTSAMTSLQQLRQAEVDTLYMRLVHEQSGQLCNRLFDEDFALPWAPVNDLDFAEESQLGAVSAGDELDGWLSDPASFAEEIPVTDELDHLAGGELQPEDSQLADMPADAEPLEYAAIEPDATSDEPVAAEPGGEQVDDFSIFSEDIFAQELSEDVAEAGSEPQADIEALFESLGFDEGEADEICGLDVGEFSAAAGKLQLVTESDEPAEVVAAESVTASEFSCIPAGITFSHASPGGGEIFSDFLDAFVEEGSSELEKLEDAVAAWERDIASDSAYAVVSRILHTIKGIAKGVGLHFYGTLIHNFETLLTALPRPQPGAEGDYFRIVNAWLDACVRGLDHIQDARADILHELPQPAGQGAAQEPETSEQSEPAREPEVGNLIDMLQAMGAHIEGRDTDRLTVHGVKRLQPAEATIIPDRIETGTYLIAAAATGGKIQLKNCIPQHLPSLVEKLRNIGAEIEEFENGLLIQRKVQGKNSIPLQSVDIRTMPYPGFPTDLQAQFMALMTIADGVSVIHETIFENRFMHVAELHRMGADIRIDGSTAIVTGNAGGLCGAQVMATDLRASASLVIAGLVAEGRTQISRIYHLERGYENLVDKLRKVGAEIRIVEE